MTEQKQTVSYYNDWTSYLALYPSHFMGQVLNSDGDSFSWGFGNRTDPETAEYVERLTGDPFVEFKNIVPGVTLRYLAEMNPDLPGLANWSVEVEVDHLRNYHNFVFVMEGKYDYTVNEKGGLSIQYLETGVEAFGFNSPLVKDRRGCSTVAMPLTTQTVLYADNEPYEVLDPIIKFTIDPNWLKAAQFPIRIKPFRR